MLRMISILGCLMVLLVGLGVHSAWAVNKMLFLDGDGDYVVVQRQVQDDFTIEFWMQTIHVHSDSNQWYSGAGVVDSECAGCGNDFGVAITGTKVAFGTGGPDITIKSTTDVNTGMWFHVAATRRIIDGAMVLYINGVKEAETTGTTKILDRVPEIYFGKTHLDDNYFNGQIDEVRIWNAVRTQAEIQNNMNQSLENPELIPYLVGYWNFDSGMADDLSLSKNHGELQGDASVANVIYVSPTGDDETGEGTIDNPYRTIQKGISVSMRHDIVQALPGIYEENIELVSDLMVLGSGAEATTITASSGNIVTANNVHNISLSGFTIDGQGSADNGVTITGNSTVNISSNHIVNAKTGIFCTDSSAPLIENNTIAENIVHGIHCRGTTTAAIQENLIRNNNGEATIMCHDSASPTIHKNTVTENKIYGIMVSNSSTPTITENYISKNNSGIWFRDKSVAKLYHNTIELNQGGISCSSVGGTQIIGNTICCNSGLGFYCNDVSNPFISENFIHSNGSQALYATHSSVPKLVRNIIRNNNGAVYCDMSAQPVIGGSLTNTNIIVDNGWAISNATSNTINATFNYWGTTDESEIAGMMYKGSIVFKPFINTLDEIIADVSGDGTISALDAALILQYVIGLIDKFPATSPISQAGQKYISGEISIDELDRMLQKWGYPSVFKLLGLENQLLQNYPNPFNPETWIPFKLAQSAPVTINIYDVKGQLIRTLHIGNKGAGIYVTKDKAAYWDGRSRNGEKVASGVYYYQLRAGEFRATRKMVILK